MRLFTLSLWKIFPVCFFTALSVMVSLSAMAWFESPAAMSCRTSSSRGVNGSTGERSWINGPSWSNGAGMVFWESRQDLLDVGWLHTSRHTALEQSCHKLGNGLSFFEKDADKSFRLGQFQRPCHICQTRPDLRQGLCTVVRAEEVFVARPGDAWHGKIPAGPDRQARSLSLALTVHGPYRAWCSKMRRALLYSNPCGCARGALDASSG